MISLPHRFALPGSVAGLVILLAACQSKPATDASAPAASAGGGTASAPAPAFPGGASAPSTAPSAAQASQGSPGSQASPSGAGASGGATPQATLGTQTTLGGTSTPSGAVGMARAAGAAQAETEAEHEHKAPHGGTLVEIGEEFAHLELVLDPRSGLLTAYALDGEAEQAVRLAQPALALELTLASQTPPLVLELKAVPNPLTGETVRDTSQFARASDALRGVSRFAGHVARVAIKGQEFTRVPFQVPQDHARN